MTDHDAARLAEIRDIAHSLSPGYGTVRQALDDAVRLLDAAARPHALLHRDSPANVTINPAPNAAVPHVPTGNFSQHTIASDARPHDASFVSRQMYGMATAQAEQNDHEATSQRYRAEAAEQRVADLEAACARHVTAYDEVARRVVELETEATEDQRLIEDQGIAMTRDAAAIKRLAAALAASEAKLGEAQREEQRLREALENVVVNGHSASAWDRARAALRPAEECPK